MKLVPLSEAVAVNPKIDRTLLADDTLVSFVPMAAVGAANGSIDTSTVRPYAEVRKGYTHFRENDVLFAKVTPCMENGKMAVARKLKNGVGFGSTEFHVLRPREGVDPHYVYHFVSSQAFRKEAARHMTGAVGLRRVPSAFLESAQVPLPALDVQREIVAELEKQFSRLDEAVANLLRVKANFKRYKASVLKAAVEGRLVETEATLARREGRTYETGEQLLQRVLEERRAKWSGRGKYKLPASPLNDGLGALPDGWTWATADQLANLITSGSRGWGDFYSDTGVLFIRAQDIKTDALNFTDAARVDVPIDAEGTRSSVTEGDILVTITGANVTKSALVPALGEMAFVSQHVALMKLAMPETASFVFNWIISPANGRKTLESWAYGAGKPGLSLEQVRALPIGLPPLAEQARIVAEVDRHLSIIREAEVEVDANVQRAQALRQSVLTKAFSGELSLGSLQPLRNTGSEPRPSKPLESATVVMAARIIAAHCHEPTFGRVRLQKQLHLATYIAQVATNDEYARKQAGPLDMTMLSGVTNRVNDLGWFRETERADKVHGGRAYGYSALTKADEYKQHLKALTPAQQKIIDELIRLMRNWTTEQCELFSTVYAAWNDLILWNLPPTEQAVVDQVHNHWHESKKKFSAEKIVEMMSKIRGWGYTPMGFGRPTFGETADTASGDLFSSQAD